MLVYNEEVTSQWHLSRSNQKANNDIFHVAKVICKLWAYVKVLYELEAYPQLIVYHFMMVLRDRHLIFTWF